MVNHFLCQKLKAWPVPKHSDLQLMLGEAEPDDNHPMTLGRRGVGSIPMSYGASRFNGPFCYEYLNYSDLFCRILGNGVTNGYQWVEVFDVLDDDLWPFWD